MGGSGGKGEQHGGDADGVSDDHLDALAHGTCIWACSRDENVGELACEKGTDQTAELEARDAKGGCSGVSDPFDLKEVEDEPRGDALTDYVDEEIGDGETDDKGISAVSVVEGYMCKV